MNSLTKIVSAACTSTGKKKPTYVSCSVESFLGNINNESSPIIISFKRDNGSGENKPNVINVENRTKKDKPCQKATSGYA